VLKLRDVETELDEERKQRLAAAGNRKKLEADLRMSAQQVDIVTKAKDDIAKQLKKAQVWHQWLIFVIFYLNSSFCMKLVIATNVSVIGNDNKWFYVISLSDRNHCIWFS